MTGGTVSYSAGTISLTFGSAPATTVSIIMTALLSGDYFTGNESNFFNSVNWLGILYLTNNKDPITTFDGTNLARPAFPITQANQLTYTNNIGNCLNVAVYKNRLLVESPTLINNGFGNGLFAQSIRWSAIPIPGSAIFTPTNLVADVAGNGGELSATTDDFLQASQLLRDQVIVFFSNSTWIFRYTGSDFAPFRFDRINASKTTSAPYASIDYDERVTSMGSKGLIACDGVNVQRYDVSIIDQFLDINQKAFFQCFGIRFDTTNQSWMLYPSVSNDALTSDTILVYNFLEQTWSTFDIALSCVGLYVVSQDAAWQDFAIGGPMPLTWEQADFAWDSYLLQDLSPNLLGGGFTGVVYQMNSGETDLDPVTGDELAINYSMTTARLNPFVGVGQKVQFGYIDFYYAINEDAIATITFYTDNTSAPSATRQLTFDGPTNSSQAVKRVYINIVGEFLQFNINKYQPLPDEDPLLGNGPIQILGMVLWARPAGRWTP